MNAPINGSIMTQTKRLTINLGPDYHINIEMAFHPEEKPFGSISSNLKGGDNLTSYRSNNVWTWDLVVGRSERSEGSSGIFLGSSYPILLYGSLDD